MTAPDRCPVVVIDDHELFSTTLTIALRAQGFPARALPVADVPQFLATPSDDGAPGLVVLDLALRDAPDGQVLHGADLVPDLCRRGWTVLVVSGGDDEPGVATAIARGAVGFLPKSSSFARLLDTVAAAASGEPVMSADELTRWRVRHREHEARERERAQRLARLSPREREVLDQLAAGRRAAAVAEHFVVSMPTVRTQIRAILAKLEVSSQLEAVALLGGRSVDRPT